MTFIRPLSFPFGTVLLALGLFAFTTTRTGPEKTATYEIVGPFCGGCVPSLTGVVNNIDGVREVDEVTASQILEVITDETNFMLALASVELVPVEREGTESDG